MSKLFPLAILALSLAACNQDKPAENPNATVTVMPMQGATPTQPETAPEPPAPATAVPIPRIAVGVQPGPEGMQVALTKVHADAKVLEVELQYVPLAAATGAVPVDIDLSQVHYTDDATHRQYEVQKTPQGQYQAQPLSADKKHLSLSVEQTAVGVVSLKFPAPPTTSPSFTLSVPGVGTFEGVSIQR